MYVISSTTVSQHASKDSNVKLHEETCHFYVIVIMQLGVLVANYITLGGNIGNSYPSHRGRIRGSRLSSIACSCKGSRWCNKELATYPITNVGGYPVFKYSKEDSCVPLAPTRDIKPQ
jgi:hypothetical protein